MTNKITQQPNLLSPSHAKNLSSKLFHSIFGYYFNQNLRHRN